VAPRKLNSLRCKWFLKEQYFTQCEDLETEKKNTTRENYCFRGLGVSLKPGKIINQHTLWDVV
jgi:hypothetical protein